MQSKSQSKSHSTSASEQKATLKNKTSLQALLQATLQSFSTFMQNSNLPASAKDAIQAQLKDLIKQL